MDHNTFEDRDTADATLPQYFGVLFQVHDGLLDITNASDLVTVSWNRFRNHDKMMLIGSSDSGTTAANDRGKLRVTLHHNVFDGIGQRAPRVRFGQVHVYNNFYDLRNTPSYVYSWGVGIESALYAEENFFLTDRTFAVDGIIERFNGTTADGVGNAGRRPARAQSGRRDLGLERRERSGSRVRRRLDADAELPACARLDDAAGRAVVRGAVALVSRTNA